MSPREKRTTVTHVFLDPRSSRSLWHHSYGFFFWECEELEYDLWDQLRHHHSPFPASAIIQVKMLLIHRKVEAIEGKDGVVRGFDWGEDSFHPLAHQEVESAKRFSFFQFPFRFWISSMTSEVVNFEIVDLNMATSCWAAVVRRGRNDWLEGWCCSGTTDSCGRRENG